jgi:hypothetical protein
MKDGKETRYEEGGARHDRIESKGYTVQINILELSNQLGKLHKKSSCNI